MRAKGMQVLTNQVKAKRPGVVIYGIGDDAHKLEVSGHNEDDTPGVRAEDQDADTIPEHRAIDVMLGPSFSKADALRLVGDLVQYKNNTDRLLYVIFDGRIASRSAGWVTRAYQGSNPHTDHVHVSGEADADDNITPWELPTFLNGGSTMGKQITSGNVQQALKDSGFLVGTEVDDDWGDNSQLSLTNSFKAIRSLMEVVAALKTGELPDHRHGVSAFYTVGTEIVKE
jgi:hypothetical protein